MGDVGSKIRPFQNNGLAKCNAKLNLVSDYYSWYNDVGLWKSQPPNQQDEIPEQNVLNVSRAR